MSQIQTFDFSVDLLRALLWQYNDAARLESILRQKQAWYDANQTAFWEDWTRDVFDLRTANDFGLAVWAIILDIPLAVASQGDDPNKPIWGFGQYRLRYFQLVTRGTVPEVNAFLAYLFEPLGLAYVNDGYDMTARYVFNFPLSSALELVLTEYDLLPRPAGVKIDYVVIGDADGWGFGRYHENFTNGNFSHA